MQKGSKSKGMNLADVAKLHGMTAQELMPQLRKGIRQEYEHTTSKQVARRTALDHLVEFPDYYDRLDKIEKMHLGGDMSKHLAPNGKPSNLNHEQWHLVRTPEFKAWFGDWENDPQNASKVVDENGEPLLVYHGTPYEFTIFKKDKPTIGAYGQGYYFTNDKSFASNYARSEGSKILTCFLNVKNIFEINDDELPMGYERYSDMANNKGLSRDFTTKLKSLSYDGIIAKNRYNENEFIVFESNQIKLADGRNTTFDSENPDIRFHLGGDMSKHLAPNGKPSNLNHEQWHLVRTPEFKAWFGDWENDPQNASKVVDENGEPLVVYHGTIVENTFNTFDYDKADLGFHFGTKEQAQNRIKSKKQLPLRKSMVNPFFLNIRILFEMTDVGEWEYPQRYIDELMSDNIIEEKIAKQKGFLRFYDRKDNTLIRDYIKSKYGNSVGFVYNNKYEGEGKSFIALSNNQIKLADGSNTTFDSENADIRFHLGGDMSKHLAPNGKPSNLNHEQWHLVRTPEFKAWFGDWENDPQNASKVVDENGEPLVVYHGTRDGRFNIFDRKYFGIRTQNVNSIAFFFTPDLWYAKAYSESDNNKRIKEYIDIFGETPKAIEPRPFAEEKMCFLYIKNPKYVKSQTKDEILLAKEQNYDGIILKTSDGRFFEIGVFKSNQIKLADGSNTTFDSENADIRFHLGGDMSKHLAPNGKPSNLNHEQWHLVRTPEFKEWFGDWENDSANASKVVDENGEPLVLWHYAKTLKYELDKFYIFNVDKQLGSHFGSLRQSQKIKSPNQIIINEEPIDFKYYQVFLNIRNPIRLKDVGIFESDTLIDAIGSENIEDSDWYYINNFNGKSEDTYVDRVKFISKSKFGYDGAVYLNRYESDAKTSFIISLDEVSDKIFKNKVPSAEDSWIAFEPNQIKLADGSNTTFDSENADIRFHLGGDMSKHLAPNGKPSNLNHEQWHLVRTPEFKAWFGDWENDPQNASKVVDDNGEPLVVYHGSIKGINVFKTSIGKNYFSPLKYIAEDFAKYKYGDNSKVYEVFLNVKKPKYFEEIDSELLELEENKSNDGIIAKYVYVDGFNEGKQYITFNSNQIKLADGSNTNFDGNNPDIRFKRGGRTIAQTPAPISERIYGSKKNVKGSAASKVNRITFTTQLTKSIKNKVDEHNEEYPDNKVTLATAKAVVRRGMGAYSKSHRPTISGGMPNSRQAWGLARLNKFLMKKSGKPVKKAYIQDDDLL